MSETKQQYLERLASYVAEKDPLVMQRLAAERLERLIEYVPEAELRRRPAPGKWAVVEILAHMAEDELVSSWRYRQMIEHAGVTLTGFDQDEWARLGKYSEWNARAALEMFRLLREANLKMLHGLTAEEWERGGTHAERGPITVRDLARHMAAHDVNHILQIERVLGRSM